VRILDNPMRDGEVFHRATIRAAPRQIDDIGKANMLTTNEGPT